MTDTPTKQVTQSKAENVPGTNPSEKKKKKKTNLTFVDLNSNHVNCDQSNRLCTISYCTYRKIQFNIEVITYYSNKYSYSYYAVIPRGTISLCQLRINLTMYINKNLIFTPKKELFSYLKIIIFIPSFIGSFCLIKLTKYFHLEQNFTKIN